MSTNDTYLAVFLGSKTSPKMMAWNSLPEAEREAKQREGIAAWKAWVEKHQGAIVAMGGPLGKTKKISQRGIEDISNEMGAFTIVRAESNVFENHPHFTIFPGESVEVMPVLPIPSCLICDGARANGKPDTGFGKEGKSRSSYSIRPQKGKPS